MENTHEQQNAEITPQAIETDYNKHQENPGPAPEAVFEHDDEGAGQALKWVLPPIILCLLIFWLIFKL